MSDVIASERLDLVALSAEFLDASLEGDRARMARLVGFVIAPEWPDEPAIVRRRRDELAADPGLQPWLTRAMVLRRSNRMIGHIGFHGRPDAEHLRELAPGAVEFGYVVFPGFRRRGHAREASVALMAWAARTHGVKRFVVSISPSNVASLALAQQLGFHRIGSHIDEIDGPEDIFERREDEPPGESGRA